MENLHERCLYYLKSQCHSSKLIKHNDLLISRVGRNAGNIYQCKTREVGMSASDYFYIVKNVDFSLNGSQLMKLEKHLKQLKRGLAANYLCKSDIELILEKIHFFR